jgi:hypothetical protein
VQVPLVIGMTEEAAVARLGAQPLARDRLVGGDELEPRAGQARQVDRGVDGHLRGLRAVGPDHDRLEHGAIIRA